MARILRISLVALLGCAPVATQQDLPTPSDIPGLQQTLHNDSTDLGARLGLAVAYRESGRASDARDILEGVVAERPGDPGPMVLLGLTYEETGEWARARDAYERYVGLARSSELRQQIERRLRYVHRRELEAEVRAALATEQDIALEAPVANAVAVFPFLFQSPDTTMRPLSRAMAELLVTDLAVVNRLRVLERARLQLLLDEIRLGETDLVDPATAARSGRILRAGRVIQGTVSGNQAVLRLEAVVVGVGRDSVGALSPVSEQDPLPQFFDTEKRLALALFNALGIQLTIAEEERVRQRPTANVQALLAFGRGLEAEDRGDWAEAARQYARALAIDPGFAMAGARAADAEAISAATEMTVQVLVETTVEVEAVPVTPAASDAELGAIPSPTFTGRLGLGSNPVLSPDPISRIVPDPLLRDSGAEILGQETIGTRTLLRLIFRRPAG